MATVSLFDFDDYVVFLKAYLNQPRPNRHRRPTLDYWATKLGYRSPRTLAMVLKRQRLPSTEMVLRLCRVLGLRHEERVYFELLVSLERNRRAGRDTTAILREVAKANPKIPDQERLNEDEFASISRWYYLVLRQLVGTPSFQEDWSWVRRRMRNKVTLLEIERAIAALQRLKLVVRDPKTGKLRSTPRSILTTPDVRSQANQLHLSQMLARASEALREAPVQDREFTSLTLKMDKRRIAEGKRLIRDFRDRFNKEFSSDDAQSVWQLNVQLFEHTGGGNHETGA